MREAVIVAYGRSGIGRAVKGSLASVYPSHFAAQVLKGVLKQVDGLKMDEIDDVIVGCAKPEVMQGKNLGRIVAQAAGLPDCVPGQTINRFCASGLQSVASGAYAIMCGQADVIIAGGVESMSMLPMTQDPQVCDPDLLRERPNVYLPMGITAENVANHYGITRMEMDEFSFNSQMKAAKARADGCFKKEIIPVSYKDTEGNEKMFDQDECIRANSNLEKMGTLKPSFKEDGKVTAGNASVTSDGAGFLVLMSLEKATFLGLKPIARFKGFATAGVDPALMGTGPIKAIPKLMKLLNTTPDDYDVIELNEAFAAQAIPCIRQLHLNTQKVNPRGGAVAMGHPLGATGAILLIKAMSYLQDEGGRAALISMCIGGGMGAAGAIEML